jgi:hypothetical protein
MRPSLPTLVALGVVAAVVVAVVAVSRPASAHGDAVTPDSVTTSGHGVVTLVPDRATVTAGVHTGAATAADALDRNSKEMNAVVAALKQGGGTELQTQQVSLAPQTDENGQVRSYAADDSVSATAAIADAGALIDAAVTAGANTVDGPALSVSGRDAAYRQALAKAVQDARTKADALARAGGFAVGPVSSVAEQSATPQPVFQAAASAKALSTPVEPGTQDIGADVTVTFAIR